MAANAAGRLGLESVLVTSSRTERGVLDMPGTASVIEAETLEHRLTRTIEDVIRTHGVPAEKLVGCFVNPLTALSAELEGRHYGGGVLELIPSEIERLLIPLPEQAEISLTRLDGVVRGLPAHEVLARQGRDVLGAMGVSMAEQARILEGWRGLRDRRQRNPSDVSESQG
jgi:hypothetical protein